MSLLEAATNFLYVLNMSATMARRGGRVQLEQSDMHLALNMAKMDKGGFSHAAIEEMQYLIRKPPTKVQKEKKRGVEFAGHRMLKAGMERHLAMLHQNHTDRSLPCQNVTTKNPQTRRGLKGMDAPPTDSGRRHQN